MLKTILERMFAKQEKLTGESMDFARDLYRAAPGGFWRFAFFTPMANYRHVLPKEAYAVAKIAAAHSEDCGPCLQTTVNLATSAGVDPQIIRAAVTGDTANMDERTATAFMFARAICAHDFASEELRPRLIKWWGEAGIAELSLAICSSRLFPMLKRSMGHGAACQRVVVGQETLQVSAANVQAA